mgnify:FL=1
MEEGKTKKKIGIGIGIAVLVIFIAVFVVLVFNGNKDEITTTKMNEAEQKQIEKFTAAMKADYATAAGMELADAQDYLVDSVYENLDLYGGYDSVEYMANSMLSEILNSAQTTAEGLVKDIENLGTDLTGQLMDGLLGEIPENVVVKNLTMKSNTVCNDGDIDAKYCVNKLNAEVYIVDENSDKWAVVVHPFMTSGSLMYRTVGTMYTEQGYNVIAPDLRGFGSSDGSVAMGYLESLDIYDWIKDLNENYKASDRYGVKVAPKTIVVHGISLGGATTLQLATNPDIAAAKGDPYTKTLTELNVKGFVDDCGYTSMSGIITGMLSVGDLSQLTSVFASLNIDKKSFMAEFNNVVDSLNIQGFENFDLSILEGLDEEQINAYFEQFSTIFAQVEEQFKQYEQSNGTITIPGYDSETINGLLEEFKTQIPSDYQIPDLSGASSLIPQNTTNLLGSSSTDTSEILNGVVGKVLMALVGVGLNDDNYDYYSNSFAEGRQFPEGSKVVIIHGTSDTTVPHSNADEVAENVAPGVLLYKWDVESAPHAFVVIGQKKDEYKNLVASFTNCVTDNTCTTITK